ncbi:hypothetical protein ACTPDT_11580 [Clostridioides difficile]|uniref:hypothetical protein n=1 Tax=Clostridioides difficile TaxID=1496 RepID=UPI001034A6B3|nr:hypothetical protein [Clostridioides difficile]MCI4264534.1 hypothetical protein [Clostridioides difficile]MCU5999847.1 hypothetical protein [Clostridioides difficile]MCU6096326.1 hypothetical protein [Clostridioides difficile]MCX4224694.1 hypothetical protein [Clostridioides difficile]MDU8809496.1 hypothetical protein [Clostridioides difficile]
MEKLKKSGITIILIEHRLYYIKSPFDRFILVKEGMIVEDLNRKDVLNLPQGFWNKNGLRLFDLNDCSLNKEM